MVTKLSNLPLSQQTLNDLANGCAFLGSGGGGDPYNTLLELEIVARQKQLSHSINIISVEQLADDALIAPCGWVGAPTVSAEKLPSGLEALKGLKRLEELKGRPVDAICPVEVGGSNGLAPLILAARTGLPVVDCDGMGRAFPESQMVNFNIQGVSASPSILTDARGNCVVIEAADNHMAEILGRSATVALGGIGHLFEYIQTGKEIKNNGIPGTLSAALNIGRSVREARETAVDPFANLLSSIQSCPLYKVACILFEGKVVDLKRDTQRGFSVGQLHVSSFDGQQQVEIEFQNENLVARCEGQVLATVPDIISVMDMETATTITTEQLKYGQRVKIVCARAPAQLRTPEALAILGPAAFGMRCQYQPINNTPGQAGR